MTPRNRQRLVLAALVLTFTGWTARDARAASIPYSTIGSVDTPAGSPYHTPVYYNGTSGTVVPPGSIDLGAFTVSSVTKTTDLTYSHTPFQIVVSSGGSASEQIVGEINGVVGPDAKTPMLTATMSHLSLKPPKRHFIAHW